MCTIQLSLFHQFVFRKYYLLSVPFLIRTSQPGFDGYLGLEFIFWWTSGRISQDSQDQSNKYKKQKIMRLDVTSLQESTKVNAYLCRRIPHRLWSR